MSLSRRAFTGGLSSLPLLRGTTSEGRKAHINEGAQPPSTATDQTRSVPAVKFFDNHELATVTAMAELIIPATDTPGAHEAHVPEYLDLILSDSPLPIRTAFLEGLWWIDGYCRRSAGASFKDLPAAEQTRLFRSLGESSDEKEETGRKFVQSIKAWTAKIYYSTAIGHGELNKRGRVPPTYVRPCEL